MLLKDVIVMAAVLLKLERIVELANSDNEQDKQDSELVLMTRCANLVLNEISTDYLPMKNSVTTTTQDGKLAYSDLGAKIVDIVSVKDKSGDRVGFRTRPSYIELEKGRQGEFTVEYTYSTPIYELGDEIDYKLGIINDRLLGYGTAAEYCVINGLYDDAAIWDKRYKDGLRIATNKAREITIPRRRWL